MVAAGAASAALTTLVSVSPIYASFDVDEQTYLTYIAGMKDESSVPVQLGLANEAGYRPSSTDMATDPATAGNPTVAAFAAQVPYARLYLPTEKDFAKIDTGIFIPAIQSAEQNGNAADALKSANDQLNSLLGCP